MSESEVRKYAYAMQIEVQRLIAEENAAKELRENLQLLLDDASAGCLVDADERRAEGALHVHAERLER